VAAPIAGHWWRNSLVGLACQVTGCTAAGMATAGWLLILAPIAALAAGALWWRQWSRAARAAWITGTVALVFLGGMFVPGRRRSLDDILDGYTELAFATGLRWAGLSVVAIVVAMIAGATLGRGLGTARGRWIAVAGGAIASVVMLGVAISRAWMPPMTAEQMYAGMRSWTSEGDTITVVSTADRDGCAGVLANDRLLDGCMRTAGAVFTTDDSDAKVSLAAVLFPAPDQARDRRAALPEGTGQQGFVGDVLTTRTVTGQWLILATVQHANGGPIADDERGYLLWALKQAGYQFTNLQTGFSVTPSPDESIKPRTG
jgi:hypothetical protein